MKAEGVEGRSFTTTYGEKIYPLSPSKLTVVHLVIALLQTRDRIFIELLADNKTYNIIRKLLVSHHFNN